MYDIAKGMQGIVDTYNTAKVGSLARLAYEQPQQRKSALAEMYGIDPNSANTMRKEFDEQDKAQLAEFSRAFINAPPTMKGQMYERGKAIFGPKIQALGGNVPDKWEDAEPFLREFAGSTGQNQGVQSTFVSNGTLHYLSRDGRAVDTGKRVDDNFQLVKDDVTGEVYGFGRRGNVLAPTTPGNSQGGQQNPPPEQKDTDPMAPHIARINADGEALRRYGLPQDQVNAWMDNQFAEAQKSVQQNGVVIGQQGTPQAPPVRQPVPQAPMGGGQARVSVKPPESKVETWGQPFEVMKDGKPVLIERSNTGRERVSQYQPKLGNKDPSGEASKAAGFYSRMEQSERLLSQIEAEGYDPSKNTADYFTAGRVSTNWLASPKGRQYYNAASNWIRANLRRESGAVIGADEMKQEFATYFPMPGDGPDEIRQKRQLRAQTAEAVRMAGAPAERAAERNAPSGGGKQFDPLGILK